MDGPQDPLRGPRVAGPSPFLSRESSRKVPEAGPLKFKMFAWKDVLYIYMIYHVAGAAVCIQSSLHQSAKTNRIEELLTCLVALVPFFQAEEEQREEEHHLATEASKADRSDHQSHRSVKGYIMLYTLRS